MTKKGRVVLNHSTHLKNLIKTLEKLATDPAIKTITPGRIANTKNSPTKLKLKVTIPITGGFKVQARSHRGAQEVFIITDLTKEELQTKIDTILA